MIQYITVYLIVVNLVTYALFWYDKKASIHRKKQRIREKSLFLISLLGGALGGYMAMIIHRHKTRHLSFRVLIPLFFMIHFVIVFYLLN